MSVCSLCRISPHDYVQCPSDCHLSSEIDQQHRKHNHDSCSAIKKRIKTLEYQGAGRRRRRRSDVIVSSLGTGEHTCHIHVVLCHLFPLFPSFNLHFLVLIHIHMHLYIYHMVLRSECLSPISSLFSSLLSSLTSSLLSSILLHFEHSL